jgi:hypothetical protein
MTLPPTDIFAAAQFPTAPPMAMINQFMMRNNSRRMQGALSKNNNMEMMMSQQYPFNHEFVRHGSYGSAGPEDAAALPIPRRLTRRWC